MMEKRETILIVDDQEVNRVVLNAILQDRYKILMAENGREAFALISHVRVDLVLLDLIMPLMDGFEFLQRLREQGAGGNMPVILITSEATKQNLYKAIDYGIADMVAKPFDPVLVLKRVAHALQNA